MKSIAVVCQWTMCAINVWSVKKKLSRESLAFCKNLLHPRLYMPFPNRELMTAICNTTTAYYEALLHSIRFSNMSATEMVPIDRMRGVALSIAIREDGKERSQTALPCHVGERSRKEFERGTRRLGNYLGLFAPDRSAILALTQACARQFYHQVSVFLVTR